MAYTLAGDDLATFSRTEIKAKALRELPDPFLPSFDEHFDHQEYDRVQTRKDRPYGPYLCPKCKRAALTLEFGGYWDGLALTAADVDIEGTPTERPSSDPKERSMRGRFNSAIVIGIFLVVAAFLVGGRYHAVTASRGSEAPIVYIVDRFTGNVWFCGGVTCRQSGPIAN